MILVLVSRRTKVRLDNRSHGWTASRWRRGLASTGGEVLEKFEGNGQVRIGQVSSESQPCAWLRLGDEDHGQSTDGDEQGTKEAPAVGRVRRRRRALVVAPDKNCCGCDVVVVVVVVGEMLDVGRAAGSGGVVVLQPGEASRGLDGDGAGGEVVVVVDVVAGK